MDTEIRYEDRTLAAAAAVISLATAPAIAEVSFARSSAPVEEENELAGSDPQLLAAAAVVGIVVASDGDDDPVAHNKGDKMNKGLRRALFLSKCPLTIRVFLYKLFCRGFLQFHQY